MPAVLNAANEVAVASFLSGGLTFTGIFDLVSETYARMGHAATAATLGQILASDREARETARGILSKS